MRLTRKKAIELSITLWTWLAETGDKCKVNWSGWNKYGYTKNDCFLCEYDARHLSACQSCSLDDGNALGCGLGHYDEWEDAQTAKDRKKYAKLFLEELKGLL